MFNFFNFIFYFQSTVSGVNGDNAMLHADQQSRLESLRFKPKMAELIVLEMKQNPATSNHVLVSYIKNQSIYDNDKSSFKSSVLQC